MSKNVDLLFYFLRTGIKRSQSLPSQYRCQVNTIALSWWRVIRLRRLVFLICWKTTGKQMVVYHFEFTVLRCSSGTIATCPEFPKKTYDHLLGSASCASNFCRIWLILKHPYSLLLFTFGLIRLNPLFYLSRCHRRVSKHRDRIFAAFLSTNRHEPCFFSNWQIVWDPTQKNFFYSQMFMQYRMYAGSTNA